MICPQFPSDDESNLARLLNTTTKVMKNRDTTWVNAILGRCPKAVAKDKKLETSPVTREVLAFGFPPFSQDPSNVVETKSQLDEATGRLYFWTLIVFFGH